MPLSDLYRRVPAPLQSLAVTARGAQLAAERYGAVYRRRRRELPAILALPRAELERLQMEELRRLVDHARTRSAYYAGVLGGVDPAELRTLDDLRALPVLEKETLRARAEEVYTLPLSRSIEGHTGGTTGKSLVVAYTRRDFQLRMAELDHFRATHGARHGMRRATFSGKHLVTDEGRSGVFWRTNWVLRQRFYSTFHMSRANVPRYVEDLERFRPQVIDGFISCIADLCEHVRRRGRPLSFRPVAVFPTAEPVFAHQRELIREVMGVELRDQYASSEGAPFVTECPRGRLHSLLHTGVIEEGEDGGSLVTSFTTYGTPLIRYRIGDRIVMDDEGAACGCGWDTPLVRMIEGRSIDFLYTPERGRMYSPNMSNVVKNLPNAVVQAQFVQTAPDRVEVRLVVDEARYDPGRHREVVLGEVRDRLGAGVRVEVKVVPEIERAASGKYRMVVNQCGAGMEGPEPVPAAGAPA